LELAETPLKNRSLKKTYIYIFRKIIPPAKSPLESWLKLLIKKKRKGNTLEKGKKILLKVLEKALNCSPKNRHTPRQSNPSQSRQLKS